jgi:hypothetical protein
MAKKKEQASTQNITWESVRRELNCTRTDQGQIDYDRVRREKLAALEAHAKHPAVLYATDFLNEDKIRLAQNAMTISPDDMRGLAEVTRGLQADTVDLILHSPGGSPEAAESIVAVLRGQFKTVRVLVPVMAKSAATMIALAANEILMPLSAELGPIDPQFLLSDGRGGQRMTPAQAIIDEVERARQAVTSQQPDAPVWLMQVQGHPPGLYQQALNAVDLSKKLVGKWLEGYMFAGETDAAAKAQAVVNYLADHNRFLSHARRVDIKMLSDLGVKIANITEVDRELWQLLEELWYAVDHTFRGPPVLKMWENSRGIGFFQLMQTQLVLAPAPAAKPQP